MTKFAARKPIPQGFMIGIAPDRQEGGHFIFIGDEEFFAGRVDPDSTEGETLASGWIGSFRTADSRYFNAHTEASHGYGPTLYDAAIIIATKFGSGLVSSVCNAALTNRGWRTSDEAGQVYQYLYKNRPDVQKRSLSAGELITIQQESRYLPLMQAKPELFAVYTLKSRLSRLGPVWPGTKF